MFFQFTSAVLIWSFRIVLWTTKLKPTFHQHEAELIMIEFLLLSCTFFKSSLRGMNRRNNLSKRILCQRTVTNSGTAIHIVNQRGSKSSSTECSALHLTWCFSAFSHFFCLFHLHTYRCVNTHIASSTLFDLVLNFRSPCSLSLWVLCQCGSFLSETPRHHVVHCRLCIPYTNTEHT